MAFLTRIWPNLLSCRVRESLANPYELHRDLMSAFPDAGPDTPGRSHYSVLHRLDILPDSMALSPRPLLLILSSIEPQWSRLPQDKHDQPWTCRPHQMKPFDPEPDWFYAGQLLRFRCRANPTKRLHKRSVDLNGNPVEQKWVGKRVEIREADAQIQWLARKADHHGFQLVEAEAKPDRDAPVFNVLDRPEGRTVGRKPLNDQRTIAIVHAAVTFDGLLQVTESSAFCATLLNGIGPAKAFGFGLLSVAPVR